jgi:hypothetical protein
MRNMFVGWPRRTPEASWSGGSWQANWPASNVGIFPVARVARSSDLLAASTRIRATFAQTVAVTALGITRVNLSPSATVQVIVYEDAAATSIAYDSEVEDFWPETYPLPAVEWEDDGWWDGKPTAADLAGGTYTRPIFLDRIHLAGAIDILISDPANLAGYVEIGHVEISAGFNTSYNMSYGLQEGYAVRSTMVEALGGARYFDRRDKPRVIRGELRYLPRDEAMGRFFDLIRQADITDPLMVVPFPDEPIHWLRSAGLYRVDDPGLLTYASHGRQTVPFAFREAL